ncbi:hypothetical protein ACTHGU_12130 [Chitinophagaceae bacterium MMS25-I14]
MIKVLRRKNVLLAAAVAAVLSGDAVPVKAQAYLETYGQNRIQYRRYEWKFFDTKHFRVYHYDAAGRQLARYISEQAEKDISVVEKRLGGQFPRQFNIILYNNYDEYRQTNVGLKYDSQIEATPAGTVDLVGDRLVVYFTGQHADLRRQLRSGMSRVVMERMLFGESFRQMVKNAVLLNLPQWTTDGFIAYLVDGWDSKADNDWKNVLEAYPNKGFYDLGDKYPELAGKAFWKYVSVKYGENSMKNLLYTMEMKSSLNQGMKMSMGMNVKKAYDSCVAFYKSVYRKDSLVMETPDSSKTILSIKIPKDNGVIRTVRVSPKGNDVAYVSWKEGEYEVYIQKTTNEKARSLILEGGRKDYNEMKPDPDYPLMAWSNNGYKLAILYKRGTQTRIRIYNSLKAKIENYIIPGNRFDRALGISFMENDDKLVFSAIRKSQTDLYEFTIKGSRMKNITNDAWDDTQPWFVSGGSRRGILFLSNRPQPNLNVPIGVNELPVGPMNVYFYDTKTKSPVLLRCTDVKTGTITQPIQYGSDNFAYLYDANGVQNKYVIVFGRDAHNMDSAYGVPVTNYSHALVSHQYNPASNQVADVVQQGERLNVYFKPLEIPDANAAPRTLAPAALSRGKEPDSVENGFFNVQKLTTQVEPDADVPELKSGKVFQTEFADSGDVEKPRAREKKHRHEAEAQVLKTDDTTAVGPDSAYVKMKAQRYRLSLKPDFFTVRLDNSILFNRYQAAQTGSQFSNPAISGLISVSLNDVLENHRFTGGVQLPTGLTGTAYFLQYENFTRRVDWGLLYLRSQQNYTYDLQLTDPSGAAVYEREAPGKVVSNLIQGNANYPIDRIRSIRLTLGLRQDVTTIKAIDSVSLNFFPQEKKYWTMSRAEFVFDNSYSPTLNIRQGFRYKFYGEYLYQVNDNAFGLYNLGVDFRYYQKIYKNFIWAVRLSGAHSAGKQQIGYSLGGVDNWLIPKQSPFASNNSDGQYAFNALATNMRGYEQGARTGNTYAVFNGELRLPIMTTFVHRPLQSAVLRHLQLVGFVDAGSAWNGLLPNSDDYFSTYTFGPTKQPPYTSVKIDVRGDSGLAMGYGAGLRTMLLGYFLRLDAAWNIEGRTRPIWYFSIGTDF